MNLSHLETPCLILDLHKVCRNIAKLHRRMSELGVNLRPHGKTAKNIDLMTVALEGQAGGIAVSTLKEAEYYFNQGIEDIVYAVGITPNKLERICKLIKEGARLTLLVDSIVQVSQIANFARDQHLEIPVLIEIDCDGHRSGVNPQDELLLDIGKLLEVESGVCLAGILTHAGESYNCKTISEIRSMAERERSAAVYCATQLREQGLLCEIVSVGSTPTAMFAEDLSGITEVRAGVFMFYDLVMAGLEVCDIDDIGITVLTSVMGDQVEKGWLISDAGWMALSQDRGTANQLVDQAYGLVLDAEGRIMPGLNVSSVNQEHGIISARDGHTIDFSTFTAGTLLRILPNHACATAAMFDKYYVVPGGDPESPESTEIVAMWNRINGW